MDFLRRYRVKQDYDAGIACIDGLGKMNFIRRSDFVGFIKLTHNIRILPNQEVSAPVDISGSNPTKTGKLKQLTLPLRELEIVGFDLQKCGGEKPRVKLINRGQTTLNLKPHVPIAMLARDNQVDRAREKEGGEDTSVATSEGEGSEVITSSSFPSPLYHETERRGPRSKMFLDKGVGDDTIFSYDTMLNDNDTFTVATNTSTRPQCKKYVDRGVGEDTRRNDNTELKNINSITNASTVDVSTNTVATNIYDFSALIAPQCESSDHKNNSIIFDTLWCSHRDVKDDVKETGKYTSRQNIDFSALVAPQWSSRNNENNMFDTPLCSHRNDYSDVINDNNINEAGAPRWCSDIGGAVAPRWSSRTSETNIFYSTDHLAERVLVNTSKHTITRTEKNMGKKWPIQTDLDRTFSFNQKIKSEDVTRIVGGKIRVQNNYAAQISLPTPLECDIRLDSNPVIPAKIPPGNKLLFSKGSEPNIMHNNNSNNNDDDPNITLNHLWQVNSNNNKKYDRCNLQTPDWCPINVDLNPSSATRAPSRALTNEQEN